MSNTIGQSVVEFSLYDISEDEVVEEGKVMVTTGIVIQGDGSLTIDGMVYIT